jgi:hypothetical protein
MHAHAHMRVYACFSLAATMDRSAVSYDPYLSTYIFTKVNIDAHKPPDKIWIGVSHVFLPTFWCAKCNSWSSHHGKIHDERIRLQNMKDAQVAKQVEQRKQNQQNHYLPPQQQDRQYGLNDNNKRSNTAYGRDSYQDKHSRDDCGQSPRDIAPTPTRAVRAAQAITNEAAHHSTMTKRNIRISQQHPTSRSTTENQRLHAK